MVQRDWPGWTAIALAVAVSAFAIRAQNAPEAEPLDAPPDLFSSARAMPHVEVIAKERHPTGTDAIKVTRAYLVETLKGLGFEPEIQAPRDLARLERNILARLKGTGPPEKKAILLCAHYDSVRTGPGAGDNASGVAAVLETLRALKAGPPLDRDVIALFDDSEERGLEGASLFVKEHPWAREVGVALNLDARGNQGPSIMFETSDSNGWLIRQFAAACPHPVATSMSMDIYRIMPNDTNMTIFKEAGIDGLNFAFSRGLAYYHSPQDTPANLDRRTLQHQGENALAMTRHLGKLDLEDIRRDDVVYFSVLNRAVLYYPRSLAMPAALATAVVFVLAVGIGLKTGRVRLGDLAVGVGLWLVALFASIFAVGGFWVVLRDMMTGLGIPFGFIELPILAACSLVAATVTLALERGAMVGRSLESMSLGALAWWVALAVGSAAFVPGSSYLFTWPSLFVLIGVALAMLMRRGSALALAATFLGTLPALVIVPPLARDAFEGLSVRMAGPSMILVVLFVGALLPLLGPVVSPRRAA